MRRRHPITTLFPYTTLFRSMRTREPVSTRLFLPVLVASVFVTVFTAFMVNVVLPPIREDFAVSEAQVGWEVTGFMLVMADRKCTRLNSSHANISYAVFCLKD